MRTTTLLIATALAVLAHGQVNQPRKFQIGLGGSLGLYGTHLESDYDTPLGGHVASNHNDGAATLTMPLDIQIGVAKAVSVGLYLESGSYLDSSRTRSNGLFSMGVEGRYYPLNKERLALFLSLDIGFSALSIRDIEARSQRITDNYVGGQARIGAQFQYYFGQTFGLNVGLKLAGTSFQWLGRDPHDAVLDGADYSASLRASGIQLRIGAQVKF